MNDIFIFMDKYWQILPTVFMIEVVIKDVFFIFFC